jgi:hypothetical protein
MLVAPLEALTSPRFQHRFCGFAGGPNANPLLLADLPCAGIRAPIVAPRMAPNRGESNNLNHTD